MVLVRRVPIQAVAFVGCLIWLAAVAVGDEAPKVASPTRAVEEFHAAIITGSVERIVAIIIAVGDQDVKATAEGLIEGAKNRKLAAPPKILDEKVIEDYSVVVIGVEGKSFRTGLDIDPTVVVRKNGEWRVAPAPAPQLAIEAVLNAAPDKDKAKEQFMQLGKWYSERKQAIYRERERKANSPPNNP